HPGCGQYDLYRRGAERHRAATAYFVVSVFRISLFWWRDFPVGFCSVYCTVGCTWTILGQSDRSSISGCGIGRGLSGLTCSPASSGGAGGQDLCPTTRLRGHTGPLRTGYAGGCV